MTLVTVTATPRCNPPAAVAITGNASGTLAIPATFTATVTPLTSTLILPLSAPLTYTWEASGLPSQTHVISEMLDAATFTWPVAGPQSVTVTVQGPCGDVVGDTHVLNVETAPVENRPPVADAGLPQTVAPGDEVTLDGSASSDPNGDPLNYLWQQMGGPAVTFTPELSVTTFTAPNAAGVLTFTLTVTDTGGLQDTDEVVVTVLAEPVYYTLTVETTGQGMVQLTPLGPKYKAGTVVTLTAQAAAGWKFANWNGDLSDVALVKTITMNTHITVTATFTEVIPDLETSLIGSKRVNLYHFAAGDILTYTIVLRNQSVTAATVVLTDPIPTADYLTYVTGSAKATSGVIDVATDAREVRWSGAVISGTPVIIEFAVAVTDQADKIPVGAEVINTATLSDGTVEQEITVTSRYNPGFGLSINDDALYTNEKLVKLGITWDTDETYTITQMLISNSGGFPRNPEWMPVTKTHEGWEMDVLGNLMMPRIVYIRFRDTEGRIYGPFMDDIIYDTTPPTVTTIEILTNTEQVGIMSMAAQDVTLRITTTDDNTGVSHVYISHTNDVADAERCAIEDTPQLCPWQLQDSGAVYVWAVDRADNRSEVSSIEPGPVSYTIFLPLIVRNAP